MAGALGQALSRRRRLIYGLVVIIVGVHAVAVAAAVAVVAGSMRDPKTVKERREHALDSVCLLLVDKRIRSAASADLALTAGRR